MYVFILIRILFVQCITSENAKNNYKTIFTVTSKSNIEFGINKGLGVVIHFQIAHKREILFKKLCDGII